ncbi:MAG: phage tail sheath C-terminal domain-containing protein [Phycisphaerales bacterium]
MPVAPTYPGVYIEEIPSGVRTIMGVATSITAFFGRAWRGPVNKATTINSYADFERIFGGLWVESTLGYAVRDFYLNGGSQAIIVRLYHPETDAATGEPHKCKTKLAVGTATLEAAYEGSWGANLRATVDVDVSADVAARLGLTKADLFNLSVRDVGSGGASERFLNVSYKDSPRRIDKVLDAESRLVRWDSDSPLDPDSLPAAITDAADDDVTNAEKALKTAREATPQDPVVITAAETAVANAKKALTDNVSDGLALTKNDDFTPQNAETNKKGLYALEQADLFNLLCIPPYLSAGDVDVSLISDAAAYCEKRRAMLLVDSHSDWKDKSTAKSKFTDATDYVGTRSKNAALFFPRLRQPNPLHDNQVEEFVPCGAVAGLFARTDTQRGVWKAPAGLDATLVGVPGLSVALTDPENGELNPLGINCLRALPAAGRVVWGSRTLQGDDRLASEWKYVPVRRLALFLEESLYRGTTWVVFEPNDEPLWAQIRLNLSAFMHDLFRQGAFQGTTPRDAYFVKCDKDTTTQNDINKGVVNILVGFAPLKPAEFVIIKIQQMAGQIQT